MNSDWLYFCHYYLPIRFKETIHILPWNVYKYMLNIKAAELSFSSDKSGVVCVNEWTKWSTTSRKQAHTFMHFHCRWTSTISHIHVLTLTFTLACITNSDNKYTQYVSHTAHSWMMGLSFRRRSKANACISTTHCVWPLMGLQRTNIERVNCLSQKV